MRSPVERRPQKQPTETTRDSVELAEQLNTIVRQRTIQPDHRVLLFLVGGGTKNRVAGRRRCQRSTIKQRDTSFANEGAHFTFCACQYP